MELNRSIDFDKKDNNDDKSNLKSFDHLALNNKLIKNYGATHIQLMPKCVKIKNEKKFLGFFYYSDKLLIIATYTIIGTFSPERNVWVWADQSMTLDRAMTKEVSELRRQLMDENDSKVKNDKFREFVKSDYIVLPTSDFCNYMITLGDVVIQSDTVKNKYSILTLLYKNMIYILFIKKILTDNTI